MHQTIFSIKIYVQVSLALRKIRDCFSMSSVI